MSSDSNTNGKVFEFYPLLPPELKFMVVDEMGPRDRCLFAGCSKLSWKQVKSSKNAIYGLELSEGFWEHGVISINVSFSDQDDNNGFRLVFKETHENYLEYQGWNERNQNWEELWRMELSNSENVVQPATAHFLNLFRTYQNTIKMLRIAENVEIDFEIDSLKNLEKLLIHSDVDVSQFLPKIQRQLKILDVVETENCRILEEWEPTYHVQESLVLCNSNINYSQFLRITAKDVSIAIGQLTEQDISHFLKSWHNGTYPGRIESCNWVLSDSNIDVASIFRLVKELEGTTVGPDDELFIKQKNSEEIAVLYRGGHIELVFTPQRYYAGREDRQDSEEQVVLNDEDFALLDQWMEEDFD